MTKDLENTPIIIGISNFNVKMSLADAVKATIGTTLAMDIFMTNYRSKLNFATFYLDHISNITVMSDVLDNNNDIDIALELMKENTPNFKAKFKTMLNPVAEKLGIEIPSLLEYPPVFDAKIMNHPRFDFASGISIQALMRHPLVRSEGIPKLMESEPEYDEKMIVTKNLSLYEEDKLFGLPLIFTKSGEPKFHVKFGSYENEFSRNEFKSFVAIFGGGLAIRTFSYVISPHIAELYQDNIENISIKLLNTINKLQEFALANKRKEFIDECYYARTLMSQANIKAFDLNSL